MAKRQYHNRGDLQDLPVNAPRDAVKVEFAKRLQLAYKQKGWNQSELARRASDYLPPHDDGTPRKLGRDVISTYCTAHSLPNHVYLEAICKALGKTPEELLPTRGLPSAGADNPPLEARDAGDGKVWLRVNQAVSWPDAVKIMAILKGE